MPGSHFRCFQSIFSCSPSDRASASKLHCTGCWSSTGARETGQRSCGGFQNWGPLLGVPMRPYDKDHCVFGSILEPLILGNFHVLGPRRIVVPGSLPRAKTLDWTRHCMAETATPKALATCRDPRISSPPTAACKLAPRLCRLRASGAWIGGIAQPSTAKAMILVGSLSFLHGPLHLLTRTHKQFCHFYMGLYTF